MLPVLLLQFLYKAVWLLFIWLPLRSHGQFPPGASGLVFATSSGSFWISS